MYEIVWKRKEDDSLNRPVTYIKVSREDAILETIHALLGITLVSDREVHNVKGDGSVWAIRNKQEPSNLRSTVFIDKDLHTLLFV